MHNRFRFMMGHSVLTACSLKMLFVGTSQYNCQSEEKYGSFLNAEHHPALEANKVHAKSLHYLSVAINGRLENYVCWKENSYQGWGGGGGIKAEWEKEGWEETVRGGVVVITQFIFREPFVFPGRFSWKSAHGLQAEMSRGSLGLAVLTTSYHFPSVSLLKVLHYKRTGLVTYCWSARFRSCVEAGLLWMEQNHRVAWLAAGQRNPIVD